MEESEEGRIRRAENVHTERARERVRGRGRGGQRAFRIGRATESDREKRRARERRSDRKKVADQFHLSPAMVGLRHQERERERELAYVLFRVCALLHRVLMIVCITCVQPAAFPGSDSLTLFRLLACVG